MIPLLGRYAFIIAEHYDIPLEKWCRKHNLASVFDFVPQYMIDEILRSQEYEQPDPPPSR